MNFVGCIPRFLKAHAGWVLTALGSAGLVGTVILTADEAPKAKEAVRKAEEEKMSGFWDEDYHDDSKIRVVDEKDVYLTFWEKVKITAPIYAPAIVTGLGTLGCFWGAQIFNAKKQAMLLTALSAVTMQFDQYREAIKAEYGEETDKKAFEISRAEVKHLQGELKKLKEESGPRLYEFASLPGVIFEETPLQMANALAHYNRNLILQGWNDLDQLYQFAGIPEDAYDRKEAKNYGYQIDENEVVWGVTYLDFCEQKVESACGHPVYVIYSWVQPYEVNVDYGFEGDCTNRLYSGYDTEKAATFARRYWGNDTVKVDAGHLCYAPSCI